MTANAAPPAVADAPAWTAFGPEDGAPIVLVHGTRLNAAYWNGQVRRLSGEFRCITMDLPGHGVRRDEPFTLSRAADDLAAVIADAARGGRAIVVGISLGGYVALEAATSHPERIRALVLAGASADPVGPTAVGIRLYATLLERVPHKLLDAAVAAGFRRLYGRSVTDPILARGLSSGGGAQALRALLGRRFRRRLFDLWVPVLVLNGALDPVFGPGGDSWATACRRGRHEVLRRAGHLSNLDRPTAFAEAVRTFAREVAREP